MLEVLLEDPESLRFDKSELPIVRFDRAIAETHFMSGFLEYQKGNFFAAIREFDQAVDRRSPYTHSEKSNKDTYLPKALLFKGLAYLNQGNFHKAQEILERVLQEDFDAMAEHVDPFTRKPLKKQRRRAAIPKHYSTFLRNREGEKPEELQFVGCEALYYLSWLKIKTGEPTEAIALLEANKVDDYQVRKDEIDRLDELLALAYLIDGNSEKSQRQVQRLFNVKALQNADRNIDSPIINLEAIESYRIRVPSFAYLSINPGVKGRVTKEFSALEERTKRTYFRELQENLKSEQPIGPVLLDHLLVHRYGYVDLEPRMHNRTSTPLEGILPHIIERYERSLLRRQEPPRVRYEKNITLASFYELTLKCFQRIDQTDPQIAEKVKREETAIRKRLSEVWSDIQKIIESNFLDIIDEMVPVTGGAHAVAVSSDGSYHAKYHDYIHNRDPKSSFYGVDFKVTPDFWSARTKMGKVVKPNEWTINPATREYMISHYLAKRLDLLESPTLKEMTRYEPLGVVRVDLGEYIQDDLTKERVRNHLGFRDEDLEVKDPHVHILLTKTVDFPESIIKREAEKVGESMRVEKPITLYSFFDQSPFEDYSILLEKLARFLGHVQGIMPAYISERPWNLQDKLDSRLKKAKVSEEERQTIAKCLEPMLLSFDDILGIVPSPYLDDEQKVVSVFFRNLHPLNVNIVDGDGIRDYIRIIDCEDRGVTPFPFDLSDLTEYANAVPPNEEGDRLRDMLLRINVKAYNQAAKIFNEDLHKRRQNPVYGIQRTYDELRDIAINSFLGDQTQEQKRQLVLDLGEVISESLETKKTTIEDYASEIRKMLDELEINHENAGIAMYCMDTIENILSEANYKPIIPETPESMEALKIAKNNATVYRALTFYGFFEELEARESRHAGLHREEGQPYKRTQEEWVANALHAIDRLQNEHPDFFNRYQQQYEQTRAFLGGLTHATR